MAVSVMVVVVMEEKEDKVVMALSGGWPKMMVVVCRQCGDRLSNLPDDLIHKVLSFVSIKLAVQTSALSPRWRYLWTSLPCLNFLSEDFKTLPNFSEFVTHVLSFRNHQIEVSSAKLSLRGIPSQAFVKRILDYVISHNVKQLTVSCLPESEFEFPLSLFSSQSLEHLTIAGHSCVSSVRLTSTWELTSLTTLHIEYIKFNDEVTAKDTGIFSKCANLKKLVLKGCSMTKSNGVVICHPGLSDLTLEHGVFFYNVIHVVAPQLKNLTLLSPLMELISSQPSPFVNLKSLKVYPVNFRAKVLETIPAEIKKYLLDGSPSATFTEVSCEEMRALTNAESALKCMAELRETLEHEKANIEKWEMTNAESALSAQIKHGEAKTSDIISKLCHIEELLTELPASKRAQIETSFSRLCTEADIVMNFMKIQSEEKQSRLSIKFHELAMAAKPSF
ncbi:F-box domain, Leucine-rich repeat domain, L domain-like protein [Artemisia annua]|uniref:F-box domain, Leucine-rich repeat domain, L domain-like protein n=1 Tax=Artemisia annua TaxID=35608 RepID=A0A2U1LB46_ARTAN|nr:F-box domain, Leucine-rich repeat domain, L domain-like protein [Artemisia annua]